MARGGFCGFDGGRLSAANMKNATVGSSKPSQGLVFTHCRIEIKHIKCDAGKVLRKNRLLNRLQTTCHEGQHAWNMPIFKAKNDRKASNWSIPVALTLA